MKEFEDWYNQFNNVLTSKSEKKMQERAWKAALEWILKKENAVRFCWRAEYKSEESIPTIYDDIREEL